jgi:NitT/TauT family transport system ATP-binding protein
MKEASKLDIGDCADVKADVNGLPEDFHAPHITIKHLNKAFVGVPLYEDFSLNLPKGKITCIFGPNGCGKSTLINMIAGLMPIDSGSILFDGKELKETNIGYVFQNYRDALFPWMTCKKNIAYPLKILGWNKVKIEKRLKELMEMFEISFDLKRYPYELSGGQAQLVSIMRAIAPKPEVLFLDEPFSALDYEMTLSIRETLQRIFIDTGVTTVVVSHDLEEAVWLADDILLLTKRPTQVAELIQYTEARPRSSATLAEPLFINTKVRSLEVFQREVRR